MNVLKIVVVEEGTRSSLRFRSRTVSIGRAIDNDIRLSGSLASRHHCRIEQDEEAAWIVDLGSSNGTQLNGQPVERAALASGDVVAVGGARLHVQSSPADAAPGRASEAPELEAGYATLEEAAERPEASTVAVYANITRALGKEIELAPLLRQIVDSAIALLSGERGFLLLTEPGAAATGETRPLRVRVARSFDRSDIPLAESRLSMGIARRVMEGRRPLLSVDAGRDERFADMASVEDLRLRSVIGLPIEIDGVIEGILIVDNRLQSGAFSEDDLELAGMFAGQAAVAIKNARLVAELRARNARLAQSAEQIRSLNQELGRKVRDREGQLAVARAELERERGRNDYSAIIGASDEMKRVFGELDRIVETHLPVVILGESGTGKELIARAIHFNGARKDKPFVVENCAALPDTLLESELFGHTRGAFTGADRAKKGLIEQADQGTLFLDEIGDMSPEMQKKLLRVLQENEVRPVGSNVPVPVDVRLLAASHQDLQEMVRAGTFREDLFYRVSVLTLRLPPLRERREDVPLLAEALLIRAAREAGRPAPAIAHEAMAALSAYDWPGNVRELENEMRRVLLLANGQVELEHLSESVRAGEPQDDDAEEAPLIVGDLRAAVAQFERRAIEQALALAGDNKSRAAKELGISRFALQRKLDKYAIKKAGDDADAESEEVERARP